MAPLGAVAPARSNSTLFTRTHQTKDHPKGGLILVLRAVRELRTVIMNGWHSYEMDAAVKMLRRESPFDWID